MKYKFDLSCIYNQVKLSIKINPVSPILIKGVEGLDPVKPDMQFIRLRTPLSEEEIPYIPGSSLKGVVRSYGEKIFKTLNLGICNIIEEKESCTGYYTKLCEAKDIPEILEGLPNLRKYYEKELKNHKEKTPPKKLPYAGHCFICRTFGSTHLASRIFFSDCLPWNNDDATVKSFTDQIIQIRPGISIDRRKGNANQLFELEVLYGCSFYGEVLLKNYQLWQLGLLFLVIDEINEGYQKIGYAKTRGLGKIKVEVEKISIRQYKGLGNTSKIIGIGNVNELKDRYDLIENDEVAFDEMETDKMIYKSFTISKEKIPQFISVIITSQNMKSLLERST
jgi:CRISPR/Cas system CSM-associated protein Csm3 (group 7 of RAMP superfamily)